MKVLMDLYPCLESLSGIPQDTRLAFSALACLDNVNLSGLIVNNNRSTIALHYHSNKLTPLQTIFGQACYIAGVETGTEKAELIMDYWFPKFLLKAAGRLNRYSRLLKMLLSNKGFYINKIDHLIHHDFIWQKLFSVSLRPKDRYGLLDKSISYYITNFNRRIAYEVYKMTSVGLYLDTAKFDLFLTQNPFPGKINNTTKLVIRYHDSVPLTHPHVLPNIRTDLDAHYNNLKCTLKYNNTYFVCNSNYTAKVLVDMLPELENRTYTVPCIISEYFYPEKSEPSEIYNIIRSNVAEISRAGLHEMIGSNPNLASLLYNPILAQNKCKNNIEHAISESISFSDIKYILSVGTLEPRKNYQVLLDAWQLLRHQTGEDIKLIVVANPGWRTEDLLRSFLPHVWALNLFHLEKVSHENLRKLFGSALMYIAPSIEEGFDLGGVEAMACQCPVLASNIGCHKELYGDAATFYDKYNVIELKEKMTIMLKDSAEKRKQITRGTNIAQKYKKESVRSLWSDVLNKIYAAERLLS